MPARDVSRKAKATSGLTGRWRHGTVGSRHPGEDREAGWQAAKRQSADALVDEGLEILDAPADGISSADVQLRRYRANHRRWMAGVRNREEYGDQPPQVNVGLSIGDLSLEALKSGGSMDLLPEEARRTAPPRRSWPTGCWSFHS